MEFKVRTWLWVVLLIVIVLGGGITYWYVYGDKERISITSTGTPTKSITISPSSKVKTSPTPTKSANETATWQTFSEKNYGLRFKYPSNWIIQSKKITTTEPGQYAQGIIQIKEIILKSDKGDEFNLRNPVKEIGYEASDWGKNTKDIVSTTGIKFARDYAPPLPDSGIDNNRFLYMAVSNTSGGEDYLVSVSLIGEFNSTDVQTVSNLDKILSTFQFTQ